MWFTDTEAEVRLVNERIQDAHNEAKMLRLGREMDANREAGGRIMAIIDSAVIRASQGAQRRQAARGRSVPQ